MSQEKNDNWMQTLWRPAMGWLYMLVCFCDMIVFPVLWALWQGFNHVPITQWNPLSLQGAGLFHIAMGAVLGIAAFGRTQEKLAGTAANPTGTAETITNNNNISGNINGGFNNLPSGGAPAFGAPSAGFGAPTGGFGSPAPATTGFGAPAPSMAASGFGSSSGFGAPATPTAATGVTTGFGGKKAPAPQDDPIL